MDVACLFLGKGALEIDPSVAREALIEESLAHVQKALKAGLVPYVGKSRMDATTFGITDRDRLMPICFCDECCCIMRYGRYFSARLRSQRIMHMIEGLSIEVDSEVCVGCGTCVKHCFIDIMKVVDGTAVIGKGCAGCGRCAVACPNSAIKMSLDDPEWLEKARARIEQDVNWF